MPHERGPLGKFADEIREEAPLPLYAVDDDLPGEHHVFWSGENAAEFMRLAKNVGAPIIYLTERVITGEEDNPERAKHVGETSLVAVSFLLGGEFHVFVKVAEWATVGEEEEDEDADSANAKAVQELEERKDELIKEFINDLKERPPPIETNSFAIEQGFRRLVRARLSTVPSDPGLSPLGLSRDGSPFDLLVQRIASDLAMDLHAKQVEADRGTVEPLITECAEWAYKSGLTSLSMGDVESFLDQKRIRVSREGIRLLWMRAKVALKGLR
jgi:hypothetical protein